MDNKQLAAVLAVASLFLSFITIGAAVYWMVLMTKVVNSF